MENKSLVEGLDGIQKILDASDEEIKAILPACACGSCSGSHNDNTVVALMSARNIYQNLKEVKDNQ